MFVFISHCDEIARTNYISTRILVIFLEAGIVGYCKINKHSESFCLSIIFYSVKCSLAVSNIFYCSV